MLAALLLCACSKKDPKKDASYIPIASQNLKDGAATKVGSYFIYQDSATAVTDSFGMTEYIPSNYAYDERDNTYNENLVYYAYTTSEGSGKAINSIVSSAYRNYLTVSVRMNGYFLSWTLANHAARANLSVRKLSA